MLPPSTLLSGPKILVVDDDEILRTACAATLRQTGYRVLEAENGVAGLELAARESPECIVLDVDMPRLDGWGVLAALREQGKTVPVLMLTGLGDVTNRVKGLGAGADDYLIKPCDSRELLARVNALLRRSRPAAQSAVVLKFGAARVDLAQRTVTAAEGKPPALTRTEFALLELLARNIGRSVSRDSILDSVWGYSPDTVTRTVETHIWRLRRKLGDDAARPRWIHTIPSAGYQLDPSTCAGAEQPAA